MTITTIRLRAAKKKGDKTAPTIEYDFGGDLKDAMTKFDDDVIHTMFVQAARMQLSEWARKQLTRKKGPWDLDVLRHALISGEWKPTIKRRGKTALERAQAEFDALSPEDKAKLASIAAKFAPAQGPLKLREEDAVLATLPQNKDR